MKPGTDVKRQTRLRAWGAWPLLAILAGCASTPPAPVEDIALDDRRPPPRVGGEPVLSVATHLVVAGDTLYSIAWGERPGLPARDRAAEPYRRAV